MPRNILQRILETKRKEIELLLKRSSMEQLRQSAMDAPPARNFFSAVTRQGEKLVNLIAEVKRASPSAGVICENFNPAQIARKYEAAGADAISVLTDEQYFQGSLDYLRQVRQAVDLPVMRKDFIIDAAQVYEARAAGADAILLIAAALEGGDLLDLMILATELRMTVLLEVHDADELMRVRSAVGFPHAAYSLLGINNRDLRTFNVDINTTLRLAELAEPGTPIVSESGIKTRRDVQRLAAAGIKAVLIGQTLMQSDDIVRTVRDMLGRQ